MPELPAALVAALAGLTTVAKGRTAKGKTFSYAYADLDDLVTLTRPVLAAHGLAALTPVHAYEGGLAVSVELLHTSGEVRTFPPLPFPAGADPQSAGSAMTYFRRYALLAALGMAAGGDDDGKAATAPAGREEGDATDVLPAIRKRLGHKVHNLSEGRRAELRTWLEENGLPDRPAAMTAEQCDAVDDWVKRGTS